MNTRSVSRWHYFQDHHVRPGHVAMVTARELRWLCHMTPTFWISFVQQLGNPEKKHHPIRPHSDPKERFVVHEKKDAVVNSQHFLRMLSTSHPVLRKAGMGSGCQVPTADGFVLLFFVAGKLAYYPGIFSAFKAQQLNGDEAEAKRLLETQETKEISPATQFGRAVWTGWTDGKRKIICRYSPSEYNEDDV